MVASLATLTVAQTPMDFQPGSLQKLGVTFTKIDIDPPGTQVQTLSRKPRFLTIDDGC